MPKEGKIRARVWGFPQDCPMEIFFTAGPRHAGTATWKQSGWKPGQPLELVFDPTVYYREIYLIASLSHYHIRTCDDGQYCLMRCSVDGPWYLTFEKGEPKNFPKTYQQRPVKKLVSYYLVVTYDDQIPPTLEPSYEPRRQQENLAQKRELIKNGGFTSSSHWIIHDWYSPSNGKGEVIFESDGVRFLSRSGNNRIGVMQTLKSDVRHCKSLIISATVRADQQTLTGTGYNGREAPVAVFVNYTDERGNVHRYLWENPYDTSQKMFWHGFYFLDPIPPSISVHGTKVQRGFWYNYSYDLMQLSPRPVYVEFIGAEGAGWSTRDGKIRNISLQCIQ